MRKVTISFSEWQKRKDIGSFTSEKLFKMEIPPACASYINQFQELIHFLYRVTKISTLEQWRVTQKKTENGNSLVAQFHHKT